MTIKIGALVEAGELSADLVRTLEETGFESLSISFWERVDEAVLDSACALLEGSSLFVSALSVWGNPLESDVVRSGWSTLIAAAHRFGSPFVTGFAGRLAGASVEASLDSWQDLFLHLLDEGHRAGVKGILMENCRMGDLWKRGAWNIAINDAAWRLLFERIGDERLGLEWEPCHQIEAFVDPIAQLGRWKERIHHIHGKDAAVDHALLSQIGLYSPKKAVTSTLPGGGDTDWHELLRLLVASGWTGSIDLEVPKGAFSASLPAASVSLEHLKECRSTAQKKIRPCV